MALKKFQFDSPLGHSADEQRAAMDASRYKDNVLTLLPSKYLSDKVQSYTNPLTEVRVWLVQQKVTV